MELLKKNIVLAVIIAISLIVSGTMIFIVIGKQSQMKDAIDKVKKLGSRASKLKSEKEAPVAETVKLIEKDIDTITAIKESLYNKFGQPRRNALMAFIEKLGSSEVEFIEKWNKSKSKKTSIALNSYLVSNYPQSYEIALNSFKKEVAKTTVLEVNSSNIHDLLLEALGIQRVMKDTVCSIFVKNQKEALANLLLSNEIECNDVSDFTFQIYNDDNLPKETDSSMIARQFVYINDIVMRVQKAKLKAIKEFTRKDKGLNGTIDKNGFMRLKYSLTVNGELENIKTFINSLTEAANNNIIYIISDISLKRNVDTVQGLNDKRTLNSNIDEVARKKIEKTSFKQIKTDDILGMLPNYGVPIVGVDNSLNSVIEFETYIFVGKIK